jgi:hypothetical protein
MVQVDNRHPPFLRHPPLLLLMRFNTSPQLFTAYGITSADWSVHIGRWCTVLNMYLGMPTWFEFWAWQFDAITWDYNIYIIVEALPL